MKTFYVSIFVCLALAINPFTTNAQGWQWAKSGGNIGWEFGQVVTVDKVGNTYLFGAFNSPTITFDTFTLVNSTWDTGNFDLFIVKFNIFGSVEWAKTIGGRGGEYPATLTLDATGNIYISGTFIGPGINFWDTLINNSDTTFNSNDIFFAKYSPNGDYIWARGARGSNYDWVYSAATDSVGNTYLCGEFYSKTLSFGPLALNNTTTTDSFDDLYVVKYDSSGTPVWALRQGGTGSDQAISLGLDGCGHLYVATNFSSSHFFIGTTSMDISPYGRNYIEKMDLNGNVLWAKSPSDTCNYWVPYIAVSPTGNIYMHGEFDYGDLAMGHDTLVSYGSSDIFVAKMDSSGNVDWARNIGGIQDEYPTCLKIDRDENVFIGGSYQSTTLNFQSFFIENNGVHNIYLAKLDSSGNELWAINAGGTYQDYAYSIALDTSKNIYMTGEFYSSSITFGDSTLTNIRHSDVYIAKYNYPISGVTTINKSTKEIALYPNPTTNLVHILGADACDIEAVDILGQKCNIPYINGAVTTLDLTTLPNGLYTILVTNPITGERVAKTVIKE